MRVKRTPAYLRNRGFHNFDIPENSRSNYLSPYTINDKCTRGQQAAFSKAREQVECVKIHMGTYNLDLLSNEGPLRLLKDKC